MCMQRLALLIWIFAIACVHCSDDDDDDYDRFVEEHSPEILPENKMIGLFVKFDTDANGKLSLKEWADHARNVDAVKEDRRLTEVFSRMQDLFHGKFTFAEVMQALNEQHEEDDDDLRERLKLVDKDKDNLLDRQEIRQLLRFEHQVEIPSDGAEKVLIALDKNGDGVLSFDEFRVEFPRLRSEDQIRVFEKADADKSGTLNVQEVAFGLSREFDIEDVLSHMFEIADKDADGYVTIGEWIAAGEDIKERRPDGYDGLHQWVEHHEL
eukprot:gnl/TRDRNA2_/TRDRNA2_173004_c1_seq2.p1 gnl/TRDRNA2_/TRDRNA2_173004_c1~~gnl/TRDRNA2_/TRDRNA2_173004_c1_seq2.p1  ORF type:complete len:267 (+),score=48.93 gnl/TRDRNA2_/TRDRNA2_173004_c1_seq2:30-830(+)